MEMPNYTREEERLHVITHGIGLIISLLGLVLLIQQASIFNDTVMLFSFIVFGSSLILCFLTSTLYHWVEDYSFKKPLRILDHFAIYFLIAGTYTPFLLNNMPRSWGLYVFGGIWFLAFAGMVFKFLIRNKLQSYERIDASLYVLLGTLSLLLLKPIFTYIPLAGIGLLILGGLAYLVGVYYYVNKQINYNHVIWHLFVILGSGAHFFAVLCYATPLEG